MYPKPNQKLSYETKDAIYFFSHAFDPINNWSAHAVKIWSKTFPTLEHAYHYRKYSDNNPEIAEEILSSPSPWAAMQVDRRHMDKRRDDWDQVKVAIMTELARAKVAQNQDVRECLLKTGKKQIIENSPWDDFWGCGAKGKGENRMGKILVQIREELKEVEE